MVFYLSYDRTDDTTLSSEFLDTGYELVSELICFQAIRAFILGRENDDLSHHLITRDELDVLRDVHQVLEIAHSAQEALSSEATPTLSMALPLYEPLIKQWKTLAASTIPELSHYINIGLHKLCDYVSAARKTRIYPLSMSKIFSFPVPTLTSTNLIVINPDTIFDWLRESWDDADVAKSREWIIDAVRLSSSNLQLSTTGSPR